MSTYLSVCDGCQCMCVSCKAAYRIILVCCVCNLCTRSSRCAVSVTYAQTYTGGYGYTQTQTHRHTHTQEDNGMHTYTYTYTYTYTAHTHLERAPIHRHALKNIIVLVCECDASASARHALKSMFWLGGGAWRGLHAQRSHSMGVCVCARLSLFVCVRARR